MPGSNEAPVEAFAAASAGPVTLFRLDAAGSPFRQKMPAYFSGEAPPAEIVQYVVLVDKALPQHTLESQELPPVVVRTIPEAGARDVPPDLAEIRVTFSKEMRGGTWSWCSEEAQTPPPLSNVHYEADRRTIVATAKLAPGQKYAIWLNKSGGCTNFRDAQGNSAVPYLLSFETAPAK
jgi:hypothetical protein